MSRLILPPAFRLGAAALALVLLSLASPVAAGDYPALRGLKGVDAVFSVSLGSPEMATVVFPAIREVYRDKNVLALPNPPHAVIVFHGPAVKLLSRDRKGFDQKDGPALDKVAEMIRQFKKDGVTLEVCMYAAKALGVDPASLMPEVNQVDNGFISVIGYQGQGYSVVVVK